MIQCFDNYQSKPLPDQANIVGEFITLGSAVFCGVCNATAILLNGKVTCSNSECEQSRYKYELERHWLPRK